MVRERTEEEAVICNVDMPGLVVEGKRVGQQHELLVDLGSAEPALLHELAWVQRIHLALRHFESLKHPCDPVQSERCELMSVLSLS